MKSYNIKELRELANNEGFGKNDRFISVADVEKYLLKHINQDFEFNTTNLAIQNSLKKTLDDLTNTNVEKQK